jgi:methyl-accepting chemotaxis protein
LKKITADNAGQQAKISLLETLIKSYVDFDKKLIVTRRQDGFAAADRLFVTLIGKNLLDKIQALVAEIEQAERTLLAERKINNERSRKKTTGLLVILEALIVSLLIVAFRIIYNNTKKRNKAELDLRRSNNFISSIINNSYNPISVRDLRAITF